MKKVITILTLILTTNAWSNPNKNNPAQEIVSCAVTDDAGNAFLSKDFTITSDKIYKKEFTISDCDHVFAIGLKYRSTDKFMMVSLSDETDHIETYTSDLQNNGLLVHLKTRDFSLMGSCVVKTSF